MFRGNLQQTGVAASALPEELDLLWTYDTGTDIESTAAIENGTVYVGSLDAHLYALDLQTGELRWKYEAREEIKSPPSVFDGVPPQARCRAHRRAES